MLAVAACLVMVGCVAPEPDPKAMAAAAEAKRQDQLALETAIKTYGVVYVANSSTPYTVTYTDAQGIEQSKPWMGRFWFAFTPPDQGHLLRIRAQRSDAIDYENGGLIKDTNAEIWVQMYAGGKLYKEDHKVGSEAYIAFVSAQW
jgi:hypothetical protein